MASIPPPPTGFRVDDTAVAPAPSAQPESLGKVPPPPPGFVTDAMRGRMAAADDTRQSVKTVPVPASSSPAAATGSDTNGGTEYNAPPPEAPPPPHTTTGGAILRGLQDGIPGVDYLGAASNELGSAIGANDTPDSMSYGDRVRALQEERERNEAGDRKYHTAAHYLSEVGGALLGGEGVGALAKGSRVALSAEQLNRLNQLHNDYRAVRVAGRVGENTALGTAYGAGESDPDKMGAGAARGAIAGAVVGEVARPVVEAGGNLVRRAGRYIAGDNAGGVDYLAQGAPQDVDAMTTEASRQRALGYEPTLVDVTNETGRRVMRTAAGAPDGAREAVRTFSDARRDGFSDDVAHAAAPISPDSIPVQDIIDNVHHARTTLADHQFEQVRHTPLDPAPIQDILATDEGQRAIDHAQSLERDPAVKQRYDDLKHWSTSPPPVDFDIAQHAPAHVRSTVADMDAILEKSKAPQPALQQTRDAIHDAAEAEWQKANPQRQPPQLTIDMADKIRRGFGDAANSAFSRGETTRGSVINTFKNGIADHASAAEPGYADALHNYSDISTLSNAADVGSSILKGVPDDFSRGMRGVSDQPVQVPHLDDSGALQFDGEGNVRMTTGPSPLDVARTAARRTLEQGAVDSAGQARSEVGKLATTTGGRQRLDAITTPQTRNTVRAGMTEAAERARRGRYVDPNVGSQTHDLNDAGQTMSDLATGAHMVGAVTHPNPHSIARAAHAIGNAFGRFGITNSNAAELITRATDPSQTDALIQELGRRTGDVRRARQIYNVVRRAAIDASAESQGAGR